MAFHCVVVTPEQQLLDESLSQAIIPAADGMLGILTGRAPLLAKLGIGALRLDLASGQSRIYLIEGGIAQMKDNKLTVLTPSAVPSEQIKAETAQSEYDAAMARVPRDRAEAEKRQADLQRARTKLSMVRH
jgi:F-type H+-transporting ATPase subunit epsilon